MTAAAAAKPADVWARLAAPLDPARIKTRDGSQGKVLRYIDAQYVAEILDREAGAAQWSLAFTPLPGSVEKRNRDGDVISSDVSVVATLTVNGITRQGIGSGRDYKAAETDSFKRAAVRFGVGKELYEERAAQKATTSPSTPTPAQAAKRQPSSQQGGGTGDPGERTMPFGNTKGHKLKDLSLNDLTSTRSWCAAKDSAKFADLIAALDAVIAKKGDFDEFPGALEDQDDDLPF